MTESLQALLKIRDDFRVVLAILVPVAVRGASCSLVAGRVLAPMLTAVLLTGCVVPFIDFEKSEFADQRVLTLEQDIKAPAQFPIAGTISALAGGEFVLKYEDNGGNFVYVGSGEVCDFLGVCLSSGVSLIVPPNDTDRLWIVMMAEIRGDMALGLVESPNVKYRVEVIR